jgi:hypothetical protein
MGVDEDSGKYHLSEVNTDSLVNGTFFAIPLREKPRKTLGNV